MSPDWWKNAEEIFLEAIDVAEADRDAFLQSACAGDVELRREVQSLLQYDRADNASVDSAIRTVAAGLAHEESWIGRRLGAYKITGELGAGGMGSVILAERSDERFVKKVSIKLVDRGMGARVRERLLEERRILANLEHPYIAKLLDAGESEEGVPYIVMEYVAGRPIHRYCSEQMLDAPAVCRLMKKVCEAVAYAHRNLVIHRDLKPSNILVTPEGTPKLLDFGIARLLDAPHDETMRAYTPDYASPEVVAGTNINTSADVYSFGVILRQLLEGIPSDADLMAISRKATEHDPQVRYHSADQLGTDIERYLSGLPVLAHDLTVGYRASKFLRRYRATVAGVALAFAGLSVTTGIALVQASRAREALRNAEASRQTAQREAQMAKEARGVAVREHDVAEEQRDQAVAGTKLAQQRLEQLIGLASRSVNSIHDTLERISGATEDRRKIVAETLAFLDQARPGAQNDPELLKTIASGYVKMATVLGAPAHPNLGDVPGALNALDRAAPLLDGLLVSAPNDSAVKDSWLDLRLERAQMMFFTGRTPDAVSILKQAIATADRWRAAGPQPRSVLFDEAACLSELAHALAKEQPGPSAEAAKRAVQLLDPLLAARPDDEAVLEALGDAYSRSMEGQHDLADVRGALQSGLRAAELRERLVARHPDDVHILRDLMILYSKLANVSGSEAYGPNLHDLDGARTYNAKMLALAERLAAGGLGESERSLRFRDGAASFGCGGSGSRQGIGIARSAAARGFCARRLNA